MFNEATRYLCQGYHWNNKFVSFLYSHRKDVQLISFKKVHTRIRKQTMRGFECILVLYTLGMMAQ